MYFFSRSLEKKKTNYEITQGQVVDDTREILFYMSAIKY